MTFVVPEHHRALPDDFHQITADTAGGPDRIPGLSMWSVSPALRCHRAGGRTKLREEGVCRLCPREDVTRHHLVPRERFTYGRLGFPLSERWRELRDADANIVPLCNGCHRLVELEVEWRVKLRAALGQAEVAFCVQLVGREWFEGRYPLAVVV